MYVMLNVKCCPRCLEFSFKLNQDIQYLQFSCTITAYFVLNLIFEILWPYLLYVSLILKLIFNSFSSFDFYMIVETQYAWKIKRIYNRIICTNLYIHMCVYKCLHHSSLIIWKRDKLKLSLNRFLMTFLIIAFITALAKNKVDNHQCFVLSTCTLNMMD